MLCYMILLKKGAPRSSYELNETCFLTTLLQIFWISGWWCRLKDVPTPPAQPIKEAVLPNQQG